MNKVITTALLAGGLMLMNSPEAAAHTQAHHAYQPPMHRYVQVQRAHAMPYWLQRHKAFRHWYRHSPLKRDRRLAWHQLYEIFRWEQRFGVAYYRNGNDWKDYYARRYGPRHHDRDHRHKGRHRH